MDKKKCKKIVYPKGRYGAFHPYGCSRNAVKAGYCKQHHPDSVVARIKKSKERYEIKYKNSASGRLEKARKRIKELEKEIARLKTRRHDKEGYENHNPLSEMQRTIGG